MKASAPASDNSRRLSAQSPYGQCPCDVGGLPLTERGVLQS